MSLKNTTVYILNFDAYVLANIDNGCLIWYNNRKHMLITKMYIFADAIPDHITETVDSTEKQQQKKISSCTSL